MRMVAHLKVLTDETRGSRSFSPSTCNPNGACGNGLEKIYPTCAVRYGYMNYIGEFRYAQGMLFGCGGKVVVQTSRGIEIGQQVSLTCGGCEKSIKRETMLNYVKNSGPEFMQLKSGRILRAATGSDLEEERHINLEAAAKLRRAREVTVAQNLDMKFVACELLFGGERIIFHFMAEGRIDFRDLVRDLAHEFHTRIEMHQVGARDEARLVADYEICGRECCCKNFLKTLRPVTMRMAKLQKATLDPSKVSGRCGRLRCCLRYEHEGYEEMDKKLPRVGQRVRTDDSVDHSVI
jgi:cell fate regulator YaaT (PSP1 superfamily)